MRNLLLLVFLTSAPFFSSAQKLSGKVFKPADVEINGQKADPKEALPYIFEFVDEKNVLIKEIKENYYLMQHATYSVKNNTLEIQFLKGDRPALNYKILKFEEDRLQLQDKTKLFNLERTKN